ATTGARVFNVDPADPTSSGASLDLRSLTVQNGSASGDGGGIDVENEGFLKTTDVIIIGNKATGDGGGIATDNANSAVDLVIINTQFLNNESGGDGGGLFLECAAEWGGSAVINDSLFQGNKAEDDGGGLDTECGNVDSDNTQFVENEAGTDG